MSESSFEHTEAATKAAFMMMQEAQLFLNSLFPAYVDTEPILDKVSQCIYGSEIVVDGGLSSHPRANDTVQHAMFWCLQMMKQMREQFCVLPYPYYEIDAGEKIYKGKIYEINSMQKGRSVDVKYIYEDRDKHLRMISLQDTIQDPALLSVQQHIRRVEHDTREKREACLASLQSFADLARGTEHERFYTELMKRIDAHGELQPAQVESVINTINLDSQTFDRFEAAGESHSAEAYTNKTWEYEQRENAQTSVVFIGNGDNLSYMMGTVLVRGRDCSARIVIAHHPEGVCDKSCVILTAKPGQPTIANEAFISVMRTIFNIPAYIKDESIVDGCFSMLQHPASIVFPLDINFT